MSRCLNPITIKNPAFYVSRADLERFGLPYEISPLGKTSATHETWSKAVAMKFPDGLPNEYYVPSSKSKYQNLFLSGRMEVPCGKCVNCQSNLRDEWSMRCQLELLTSAFGLFVTLTYDDDNVPDSVSKSEVQLYLMRLRKGNKNHAGLTFRYFLAGEYGDIFQRPHYHIIFFFDNIKDYDLRTFDYITNLWAKGNVQFGMATPASIHYTCKYIIKDASPEVPNVAPPFRLMSRMPGIGYYWLNYVGKPTCQSLIDNIVANRSAFINVNGYMRCLPRYLRNKLHMPFWNLIRSKEVTDQQTEMLRERECKAYHLFHDIYPTKSYDEFLSFYHDKSQFLTWTEDKFARKLRSKIVTI